MIVHFKKMFCEEDFVIIDSRENGLNLSKEQRAHISERKYGIGCKQLIVIKRSKTWTETNFIHAYNSSGEEIEVLPNAIRCVSDLLMIEDDIDNIVLETVNGSYNCYKEPNGFVRIETAQTSQNVENISGKPDFGPVTYVFEGQISI